MNEPIRCGPGRQPCPNPWLCEENCHFTCAGLQQWHGGQQVDEGLPVDVFDLPSGKSIGYAVGLVVGCVIAALLIVNYLVL